jgi:tetratricopeptide (TPR) repeat protein
LFRDADVWAQRAIDFGTTHNVLLAQAIGTEFLGEDAVHTGEHAAGLRHAEREQEIVDKLHSRERRDWTHFVAAMNSMGAGDSELAEKEFTEGIALAESIGELRVASLLKGNFAVLQADLATGARQLDDSGSGVPPVNQQLLDQALQTALENFQDGERSGLVYSRLDARRTLAHVRFRRAELDEAERLYAEILEIGADTESRVSRLWVGPMYIEVLLAVGKRDQAVEHLRVYQELVAVCQSPRFSREAERLALMIKSQLNV